MLFVGFVYVMTGLRSGHFRRNLMPSKPDRSSRALQTAIAEHLRFAPTAFGNAWSYNVIQHLSYLAVVFLLFPLLIWTGLAMAPGFTAVFPLAVTPLGGHQSPRTLHFFVTIALVLFTLAHVTMIVFAGFRARVRAMIDGKAEPLR